MTTLRSVASAGFLTAALAFVPGAALANDDDDHRERGRYQVSSWRGFERHERHDERHERRSDHRERRDDRRERWDDRHERVSRHHFHGPSCGHAYYRPSWRYRPSAWPAPYYCRSCSHYFHRLDAFHDHVHHYHRIPRPMIPGLVFNVGPGWIFYHD